MVGTNAPAENLECNGDFAIQFDGGIGNDLGLVSGATITPRCVRSEHRVHLFVCVIDGAPANV